MRDLDELFTALAGSEFRRRCALGAADARYLAEKGLPTVMEHGRGFVAQRLAPARPTKDGRQTPMGGHPFFVAQHATATCCRGCLERWHGIPRGRPLTKGEIDRVLAATGRWLSRHHSPEPEQLPLV